MRQFLTTYHFLMRYGAFCPMTLRIELENIKPLSCSLDLPPQYSQTCITVTALFFLCCLLGYVGQGSGELALLAHSSLQCVSNKLSKSKSSSS